MTGSPILVDTNILIYLLNGDQDIAESLQNQPLVISVITELELQCYPMPPTVLERIRTLLSKCLVLELNSEIKSVCIDLVKNKKLKLADGIIAATSVVYDPPLITADKQFTGIPEINLVLYQPPV